MLYLYFFLNSLEKKYPCQNKKKKNHSRTSWVKLTIGLWLKLFPRAHNSDTKHKIIKGSLELLKRPTYRRKLKEFGGLHKYFVLSWAVKKGPCEIVHCPEISIQPEIKKIKNVLVQQVVQTQNWLLTHQANASLITRSLTPALLMITYLYFCKVYSGLGQRTNPVHPLKSVSVPSFRNSL